MTWADTLAIMDLMDDARRQVGVRYPADDTADEADPPQMSGSAGGDDQGEEETRVLHRPRHRGTDRTPR